MAEKNNESSGLSGIQETPQSTILGAFRQGMIFTAIRLLLYFMLSCSFFRTIKRLLSGLNFYGESFVFQTREKLWDKHLVLKTIFSVFRLGIKPVLVSFLLVAGIYWLSFSVVLPPELEYVLGSGTDSRTYVTLLTTIAGITGIFLALYFTTLSSVAISYSEPHQREIRNLIMEHPVSRGYMLLLAHLGSICLFGLSFLAVGFPSNLILMIYVILVAGVAIFSFFWVGHKIFQFLDPGRLAKTPAANFLKSGKNASILGTRWKQPSFQHHFRKQALYELYRLECLMEFALSQPARRKTVRDLCIYLLDLLSRCVSHSRRIPSLSMWFPQKRVFQEWGFTSSIQTDIAMRTGTTPQPEEKPDYLFVCNAISHMVRQSLESLLKAQDYSEVAAILIKIHRVMGQLGQNLAIDEACHLLSEVRDVLFSDDKGMRVVEANDRSQAMSMASAYGTCILNLAISASQNLERRTVDEILSSYADLRLNDTKQLYKRDHPREVLRHLEEFHKLLLFEQKTEGRICSSDWFIKEHIARRYADYIWNLSEQLVKFVTDFNVKLIEKLMNANVLWTNAELLRSSIETTKKVGFRFAALKELHKKLAAYQVTKEDWIDPDFTTLEQKLQAVEMELLSKIASIAHKLTIATDVGEFPDYAGIFRAYLGDAIVLKMENQDINEFETLFTGIFKTTFEVASHNIGTKDEHFSKPHMKIAFDTILDILDLSGLALLFSELHGSSFYDIVKKEWDAYFSAHTKGKLAIEFFYASISMALQLAALSASGTVRFNWERSFVRAMANAGFDIEGRMSQWEEEEEARTVHKSRIIQSIRPHMGMIFRRPYEYFAAFYLSERPEAEGVELPTGALECKHAVDRENRRQDGEMDS